jgi:tetratricopeptide (TPR) repeat protein
MPAVIGGMAAGAFVALRALGAAPSAGFGLADVAWRQYLFTQFGVFFRYVQLFVLPVNLNADYDYPLARSILDRGAVLWLLLLIICAAAAWIYRRRYPLASYGFWTVVLLLAPTTSVLPIRDPIAERRMYLPMIGYLFILLDGLRRLHLPARAMTAAMAAVLVLAGTAAHARNRVWSGSIPLWEDTARKSPHKRRPRFQLAFAYYEAARCGEAAREFAQTATIEPPDYELLVDWALALDCQGRAGEALEKLRAAAAKRPTAQAHATMAMIQAKQSQWEPALAELRVAEQLDPAFTMTYIYRGNIYLSTGRAAEAVAEFQKALSREPHNELARAGLVSAQRAAPALR